MFRSLRLEDDSRASPQDRAVVRRLGGGASRRPARHRRGVRGVKHLRAEWAGRTEGAADAFVRDPRRLSERGAERGRLEPARRPGGRAEFNEHIEDRQVLAKALAEFDIIVAMRERTPFDAWLFDRLPKLRLLVTTGMRNASIDLEAATKHGVTVGGHSGVGGDDRGARVGPDPRVCPEHHQRGRAVSFGREVADDARARDERQDARGSSGSGTSARGPRRSASRSR